MRSSCFIFISQFVRCGNCSWIGGEGKFRRDGLSIFHSSLKEILNVLYFRTEDVLG